MGSDLNRAGEAVGDVEDGGGFEEPAGVAPLGGVVVLMSSSIPSICLRVNFTSKTLPSFAVSLSVGLTSPSGIGPLPPDVFIPSRARISGVKFSGWTENAVRSLICHTEATPKGK